VVEHDIEVVAFALEELGVVDDRVAKLGVLCASGLKPAGAKFGRRDDDESRLRAVTVHAAGDDADMHTLEFDQPGLGAKSAAIGAPAPQRRGRWRVHDQ
jgi:hypothetical protein